MSDDGKNKGRRRGAAKTTGAERGLASKGGVARAKKLSPKRRSEIAREGALAKQAKAGNAPAVAKYGAPDRPLRIGAIEIPCYVLADGTRVLAQRGLQSGIGLSEGGGKGGARKLVTLMEYFEKKGIDTRGLIVRAESPIRFMPPHGGNTADGYEATILPDICAVVIDAATKGKLGKLRSWHQKLAEQCAILQHGFATVGIIALVDEATGYASRCRWWSPPRPAWDPECPVGEPGTHREDVGGKRRRGGRL